MKYNGAGNLIGNVEGARVTVGNRGGRVGDGDAVGVGGSRVIVGRRVGEGNAVGDAMAGAMDGACVGNGGAVGELALDAVQASVAKAKTSSATRR